MTAKRSKQHLKRHGTPTSGAGRTGLANAKARPLPGTVVRFDSMLTKLEESARYNELLRRHFAVDRARRMAEFHATVTNPTERPNAPTRSAVPKAGKLPLRILAEGDSWFKYPWPPVRQDGVIVHLHKLLKFPICNLAEPGDAVRTMLGFEQRREIMHRLDDVTLRFDAILFSGGGNDLVGDQFCIYLKDTPPPPATPAEMLNQPALNAALALLEEEYRELIRIRDKLSRDTVIFVNCYDFPGVTGIPAQCKVGPWIKPYLDWMYQQVGVPAPTPKDEYDVVRTLLTAFKDMLGRIAADKRIKNFVVVRTQGVLTPGKTDWQNEIHPSTTGFKKIAQIFYDALVKRFP